MPPPEKAEKLRIDGITYDSKGQEFVVAMSCKFGLATAGEHADFLVSTGLEIDKGGSVSHIDPKDGGVRKETGAVKEPDGMIKIEAQHIPWDRDGGTYEGTASVTAKSSLKTPGGGTVGGSESSATHPVKVTAAEEPPPALVPH